MKIGDIVKTKTGLEDEVINFTKNTVYLKIFDKLTGKEKVIKKKIRQIEND